MASDEAKRLHPSWGQPRCESCHNRYGVRWEKDQLLCRLCAIDKTIGEVL